MPSKFETALATFKTSLDQIGVEPPFEVDKFIDGFEEIVLRCCGKISQRELWAEILNVATLINDCGQSIQILSLADLRHRRPDDGSGFEAEFEVNVLHNRLNELLHEVKRRRERSFTRGKISPALETQDDEQVERKPDDLA
jgi:hypothetical protein